MQTFKAAFTAMIFFFSFFVISSYGADTRIGVVNIQRIVEGSSAGKKIQAEIKKEGMKLDADLKKRGANIENMKKKLEREAPVMSKEQREKKERELNIKVYDFKSLEKKYKETFFKFQNEKLDRMRKEILELVQDIGKKEGYHLIIQKAGVLYFPDSIDITDKLIDLYNAKF